MEKKRKTPEQIAQQIRTVTERNTDTGNYTQRPNKTGRKPKTNYISKPLAEQSRDERPWIDEYYMQQMMPMSGQVVDAALAFLDKWMADEKNLVFEMFLHHAKIRPKLWSEWIVSHPKVKDKHQECMDLLAARRETLALMRQIDPAFARWTMPAYSKKFRELEEWRSRLAKADDRDTPVNVQVIQKIYPENEFHVFPKKDDDEDTRD